MFSLSPRSFHSLLILPAFFSLFFMARTNVPDNQPPVANPDHYTVHGSFSTPGNVPPLGVLSNDSDPDGDPLSCVFENVSTSLGTALVFQNGRVSFTAAYGKTGTVTVPYTVCDNHGACADSTITFDVVNEGPVAASDEYTVHGVFDTGLVDPPPYGVLKNDTDPEGDTLTTQDKRVDTAIGTALIFANGKASFVQNNNGQTGDVTTTYAVCDNLGACSEGTVTFHVVNNAPIALNDVYIVREPVFSSPQNSAPFGPLKNDSDPEGDAIQVDFNRVDFAQGTGFVYPSGGLYPNGRADFVRNNNYLNFTGVLTMQYTLRDSLGATSVGTVYFILIGLGENDGLTSCNARIGKPVNVTNGNMYITQSDYALPAVGFGIDITRTYNSNSQTTGLFGRGWSSQYDESIVVDDSRLIHLRQPDGRVIYFTRPGTTGSFTDLIGDLHAQVSQGSGYTLALKDGSLHQFDSNGKLLSIMDRSGNATALTYGVNGFLSSVTDPVGRALTINTNANGQVSSISDSLGTVATYSYGGSNELLSVTYADNSAFTFAYDGSLRLTTVTDALGNIVESHIYDGQGRTINSERQGGVDHYSLSYISETETDVTDGLGRVTKYTFDKSKGRNVVTRVEGLCGCGGGNNSQVQTWTYDHQSNVTLKTDALNHATSYTYDANGNPLTQTDPTGTVTYTYNGFAEVLTRKDQMDGITTNTYDGLGNLLTTKDALDNITTFTYNTRGQMLTATDARQKSTTFTFDASGNLTQRKDANNIITFFFYDARSRMTKVRDGLSRSTLFGYDAFGRINKVTHPDNSIMTFTYDLAGRRTVVTDERSNPTNYGYDGAYRLTSITDALTHGTTFGYDSMSNPTSVTDALTHTTNYDYDAFNRLVKITYPPATTGATRLFETVAYDADGNVMSRTDTANRTTSYAYDNVNRVTSVTDADDKPTSFAYDPLSRVTSLTDAINQEYQFIYDAKGRQTQMTRGGVSMSYVYDEVGNRTQRTDYNGVVTNYTYDNLNRLTTITYPTRTVTYAYDPLNNLTRATNENGSVYMSYDNRYRVNSVSDPFYYGISYNYDTVGNRTKLKVNGATYATYTYDGVNRLTNLADSANLNFTYSYDATNKLTGRSAPNGVTSSYSYDDLDRLTSLMHTAGATTLSGNLYAYNDANDVLSWTTQNAQRAYTYDAVDRLTDVSNFESPTENYTYDAVGNRTASHLSATYSYQPFNKLTSTVSAAYGFDNNGNVVSKNDSLGTWTFVYDEENHLTQVTVPNGPSVSYKYDGLGRRIQRTTSAGANERYVYDSADVLLDLNADWSVAKTHLNGLGIDNHLRQTSPTSEVSYYLNDHLGSTAALTDGSGSLQEQVAYDSFGNSAGSSRTRYGYTGRERDPDTRMLYYRARFYDPELGRFITEDPLQFRAHGADFYSYVNNDPLRFRDPKGHDIYGLTGGASTSIGLGDGGAGSVGYLVGFNDANCGLSFGGAGSVGGFFGSGGGLGYPDDKGFVIGGGAGAGGGIVYSNASSFQELAGPFETTRYNFFVVTLEIDESIPRKTYVWSLTGGKGVAVGIDYYKTSTPKWSIFESPSKCRCAPPRRTTSDNGLPLPVPAPAPTPDLQRR